MRKIAVMLNKGGVGKTTTAVNLAYGLSQKGRRVLLVDTDDQGQCSTILGIKPTHGLANVLSDTTPLNPVKALQEVSKGLYLISGGESLALSKKMLSLKEMRSELTLLDAMACLDSAFDYVIIDTSPSFDVLSLNVLFYCDEVLTPVSLESLSLDSLASFRKRLLSVKKYNANLKHSYLLPTFQDGRVKKSSEILGILKKHFSDILCDPISYSSKLSESAGHNKTIFQYNNNSIGAKDYGKLIEKVMADEK